MIKRILGDHAGVLLGVALLTIPAASSAAIIAQHTGNNDPLSEGFTVTGGAVVATPIVSDLGIPTWQFQDDVGGGNNFYTTGSFSTSQKSELSDGWKISARARIVDESDYNHNAFISIDNGSKRFGMTLSLDENGDTSVLLIGSPSPTTPTGINYTAVGSGNNYLLFELIYESATMTADLFVDGAEVISDYAGHTQNVGDLGFFWGSANGSTNNFNLVSLETFESTNVPTPVTLLLMIGGLLGVRIISDRSTKASRH